MKAVSALAFNRLAIGIHNAFFNRIRGRMSGCVVDLGCGAMPYRDELIGQGCRYVGVDWPHSVHGAVPDVVADLNQGLDLPDGFADAVMSFSVLEHLSNPDVMLRHACRILRPGGLLFLQVPFQWWVHEAPQDFFRYTRHGLKFMLAREGFAEIEIRPSGGFWTALALKLNYHTHRWVRGPRPLRWALRGLLTPFWVSGQLLAPLLDRMDPDPDETVGYTVEATKPLSASG